MKKNINTGIAVAAALGTIGFLFYGNQIVSLFTPAEANPTTTVNTQDTTTGVKTTDTVVGTGAIAAPGDTVTVDYVGTLTDGKVFDSSIDRGQPIVFVLGTGQVIKGWDEGLVGMKVGGKRRLTIAPDFGYGSQAVGPIPANSTLIFDVQLLKVDKPQ